MDKVICKGCKADITDCWKFVKMGVIDSDRTPHYGSSDTVWVLYEFECPYCNCRINLRRIFNLVEEEMV